MGWGPKSTRDRFAHFDSSSSHIFLPWVVRDGRMSRILMFT